MTKMHIRRSATVLAAAALLTLTACAPADPSIEPGAPMDPGVQPIDPAPIDESLVRPPCDARADTALVQDLLGTQAELVVTEGTVDRATVDPEARDAATGTAQDRFCLWGIENSDGGVNIAAAELPREAGDSLIRDLRDTGAFAEGADGTATWFSREVTDAMGATAVTYLFDDELWVIVSGTTDVAGTTQLATEARDAVLTGP